MTDQVRPTYEELAGVAISAVKEGDPDVTAVVIVGGPTGYSWRYFGGDLVVEGMLARCPAEIRAILFAKVTH